MTTFLALYRGHTVSDAKMVAVTAEPALVATVAAQLLELPADEQTDPVLCHIDRGRRAALRLIHREVGHANE